MIPASCRDVCQDSWQEATLIPSDWYDEEVGKLVGSETTSEGGFLLERRQGTHRAIGTLLVDSLTNDLVTIQWVAFTCRAND
jgi:hypothetical protein